MYPRNVCPRRERMEHMPSPMRGAAEGSGFLLRQRLAAYRAREMRAAGVRRLPERRLDRGGVRRRRRRVVLDSGARVRSGMGHRICGHGVLRGRSSSRKKAERIDVAIGFAGSPDAEIEVGSRSSAVARADRTDEVALPDRCPARN